MAALLLVAGAARADDPARADSAGTAEPGVRADSAATAEPPRTLPPAAVRTWQTGLLRADRLEHASLSFTLGLGVGLASREPAAALAAPAALGLFKEIADRHGSGFDLVDLGADLIGAAAAGLVTSRW